VTVAKRQTTIAGREILISNPGKVLYPATGFTKRQIIDYYTKVSTVLLPHLKNRALTLKRYPDGVESDYFYEKQCPSYRPRWMRVARVWSKTRQRTIHFCVVNDLPALVWVANLANIELHASLARSKRTEQPTALVFDLDPGPGTQVVDCARVAIWLRRLLDVLILKCFPKTSGSRGLQVYVPLNTPVTFDETKTFAKHVASMIAQARPDKTVITMSRKQRLGKVFIDWSQNDHHKTTVTVYSLRAMNKPTVSTPLRWQEVEQSLTTRSMKPLTFGPKETLKRVRALGDLFEPVLSLKQRLPKDLSLAESAAPRVTTP
jgi:bifunctional non-homologous end joining protein LigD